SVGEAAPADPDQQEPSSVPAGFSVIGGPVRERPLHDSHPAPAPETSMRLASLSVLEEVKEHPRSGLRAIESRDECLAAEICIDEYLWWLYERTPKLDTNKV